MKNIKYLIIFLSIFFFLFSFTLNSTIFSLLSWTDQILINADIPGRISVQNIEASPNGNISMVWQQGIDTSRNNVKSRIYFCESINNSWKQAEIISDTSLSASYPEIIIDNSSRNHAVWGQRIGPDFNSPLSVPNTLYYSFRQENNIWSKPEQVFNSHNLTSQLRVNFKIRVDKANNLFLVVFYWDSTYAPFFSLKIKYSAGWTKEISIPFEAAYFDFLIDNNNTIHLATIHPTASGPTNVNSVFYSYSIDSGMTWKETLVNISGRLEAHAVKILRDEMGIIHLLWRKDTQGTGFEDCIYHSFSNDGINWSQPNVIGKSPTGIVLLGPYAVLDSKNQIHLFWMWAKSIKGEYNIYYSCWNGNSWSNPEIIQKNRQAPKICIDNKNIIHLVSGSNIEGLLPNNVMTWFYIRTKNPVINIPQKISIPEKYLLLQNYPNPFNPETIIEYCLPKIDYVSLKIYDLNGAVISDLVNTVQTAGVHKVKFNNKNISSGIYFYQLRAGNFNDTKRMVILK